MRLRLSVRLWQTALFVIVVLVAIGLLWLLLVPALQSRLEEAAAEEQIRDVASVSATAGRAFPLTDTSLHALDAEVRQLHALLGDDIWVFDVSGAEVAGAHPRPVSTDVVELAWRSALADDLPYTVVDLDAFAVAARSVYDREGRRAGVVVMAEPLVNERALLEAATDRLRTTFWIALVVSGALGLLFSDLISRRVGMLNRAARAIASGDFDQRLPKSLMPDEVRELADEYNAMAERLGVAFGTLAEREREIAAVVHNMAEGVIGLDASGRIRLVNEAAESVLLMKAEDLVGRPVGETILDESLLALAHGALGGEAGFQTLSLGRRILRVHATPMTDEEGVHGAVLVVADVTEQTLAEDAQRRFIAIASHEMRTPIAAMKGFLELLRGPARDDEGVREDFIRTMQLEVERLSRLVTELFTLAQIDAGRMQLDLRPQSFAQIVDDVCTLMRPVAEESGAVLRKDMAEGDLCVFADRDRVVQALIALIDNAVKHAPDSVVTVSARVDGASVVAEVSDDGRGIHPEAIPHLFDRFYRAERGSGSHGAGLGLAIVHEIVQAHGSEIRVRSELGAGTTFSFTLQTAETCDRRSSEAV